MDNDLHAAWMQARNAERRAWIDYMGNRSNRMFLELYREAQAVTDAARIAAYGKDAQ